MWPLDSVSGLMYTGNCRCEVFTLRFLMHLTLSGISRRWNPSKTRRDWGYLKGVCLAEENIMVFHNNFAQWLTLKLGCLEWDPGGSLWDALKASIFKEAYREGTIVGIQVMLSTDGAKGPGCESSGWWNWRLKLWAYKSPETDWNH